MLAGAARAAAIAGDIERAGSLSDRFEEARLAIDEADTYNLDRKQHALNMIVRLQDTFRM
jgi:DNA polymerase-3 subunit delta'